MNFKEEYGKLGEEDHNDIVNKNANEEITDYDVEIEVSDREVVTENNEQIINLEESEDVIEYGISADDDKETVLESSETQSSRFEDAYKEKPKKGAASISNKMIALVLVAALVAGGGIGAGYSYMNFFLSYHDGSPDFYTIAPTDQPNVAQMNLTTSDSNIVSIVESVSPSIVAITSKVYMKDFFNNVRLSEGTGSGVIFKVDGDYTYILTNNHVIADSTELMVEVVNGQVVEGTLVGSDKSADLAIVKIKNEDVNADNRKLMKPVVFGDSDNLKAGETAIAIGNPLNYNNTVTVGVISALDRKLEQSNSLSLIQTDAAINPGNSGGALVNSKGEVIGINTIKISDTNVEGIGFAIAINDAKPLISELLNKGYISRPYLGIYGGDITDDLSKMYELPIGVYVSDVVQGSGADLAGIQKNDVIIAVDDSRINSMADLSKVLEGHDVGDVVIVKIVRNSSEKLELKVKLSDKSNQ